MPQYTYCKLNYIHQNNGREIVQQELSCIRACGKPSQGLQRLLLSLIKIEIRQEHLNRAKCIISKLLGIYSKIAKPDINERVGHVRTLIARARISRLPKAERNWNAALLQNRAYNPLEKEVFTYSVIYLLISSVRFQLENLDGSRVFFRRAIEVLCRKKPQFLMPGVGTYLLNSVRSDLQSTASWIVPSIVQ